MKYLMDTSVLIHSLISRPKLNHRALELLADNTAELYLSAVSSWEITIKVGTGKLVLPEKPAEFASRAMRLMSLKPLLCSETRSDRQRQHPKPQSLGAVLVLGGHSRPVALRRGENDASRGTEETLDRVFQVARCV